MDDKIPIAPQPAQFGERDMTLPLVGPRMARRERIEDVFPEVRPLLGDAVPAEVTHTSEAEVARKPPTLAPSAEGLVEDTRAAQVAAETVPPQAAGDAVGGDSVGGDAVGDDAAVADGSPEPLGAAQPTVTPLPPYIAALQRPIEQSLQIHAGQRLNTAQDSCWSMMHAFLGGGEGTEILVGGPRGQRTNAIQWVAQNQSCGGRRLFYLDGDRLRGREGPGYQGHPAQFLAMLAQCNVDPELRIRVNEREFDVYDLIREEQLTCDLRTELTFKLIGMVHYLDTEATWTNERGDAWSVPRILGVEMSQPVNGAACGGTHRLMGISYALAKRRQEQAAMDGTWQRAAKYESDYHRYTMTLQNSDGTFSSEWFRRKAHRADVDRQIQTTGHMLEWLVFSLPKESLYDPRIARSVSFLAQTLIQQRHRDWEVGPKGHAMRALRLYHERVFQSTPPQVEPVATRPGASLPQ